MQIPPRDGAQGDAAPPGPGRPSGGGRVVGAGRVGRGGGAGRRGGGVDADGDGGVGALREKERVFSPLRGAEGGEEGEVGLASGSPPRAAQSSG